MTDTTPRAALPELAASQAQKDVTHNEALVQLDALVGCRILDRDLSAPPASPADGDAYVVKATGTGAWTGQDGKIAASIDGGWRFYTPFPGLIAYIDDEAALMIYLSGAWASIPLQAVDLLGVNATADLTNRLTVKSSAVLLDNVGNGMQAKINKNAATDTASFLYQTGYSGRAEIGLCGDDSFHFKVSPDGSSWTDALVLDKTTGRASFAYPSKLPNYTVATLPSAATAGAGARAFVTDANSTTFDAVAAGSGTHAVPVFSDGTSWRIG